MADPKKRVMFCPLMSVGTNVEMVCIEDRCAWYLPSVKKCSVYMNAYNALLDVTEKQKNKR